MPPLNNLTGLVFGQLTVLEQAPTEGKVRWLCQCLCGKRVVVVSGNLVTGCSTSCGCLRHVPKHGMFGTGTYLSWATMLQRCQNPNATSFPYYGARGITVSADWQLFQNFFRDMGVRPTFTTLDRDNPHEGYRKGNCSWSDKWRQANNKRDSVKITNPATQETLTVAEWVREYNIQIDHRILYKRVKAGWDFNSIFFSSITKQT